MKRSSTSLSAFGLALVGAITLLATACNSDNKNGTPIPSNAQGGSAATGGAPSDTTGGGDTSVAAGGVPSTDATGGAPSTGATGGAAAIGGASSTSTAPCTHDPAKACYECTPTTTDQILAACSNATCYPFDNTARGVPATLPTIP